VRVSDPGNGLASGSGRAGLGVGLKVLVGPRVAFRFGRFRGWSWRKEVELWGWLWVGSGIRAFKVLTEGLPKPQPIGEGTFGFCSSALMSLVSGFAATT
jgi:hypothetical protein